MVVVVLLSVIFLVFVDEGDLVSCVWCFNIVVIYGDDVGYGDFGSYGVEFVKMFYFDWFVENGLWFMDVYFLFVMCMLFWYVMLMG